MNKKKTSFELMIEDNTSDEDMEEFHYVNTMNAFVELIVVYGYDKVIGDLRTAMAEKTW